jgi:hypothetical protein
MYLPGNKTVIVNCKQCGTTNEILVPNPPMVYEENGKTYYVVDYTFFCGVCRHPHLAGSRISAREEPID